jgi:two-component system response regulator HupR/HoxA
VIARGEHVLAPAPALYLRGTGILPVETERRNGRRRDASERGLGNPTYTFILKFSRRAPKNGNPRMNMSDANAAAKDDPRAGVLVVDDQEPLLEIYAAILKPHFSVTTAMNAAEAYQCLEERAFKVIVADYSMPGENGLDLLMRAREAYPHMQRIMVTGNMAPETLLRATRTKLLYAFLLKPISILELLRVVHAAAQVHDASLATTS